MENSTNFCESVAPISSALPVPLVPTTIHDLPIETLEYCFDLLSDDDDIRSTLLSCSRVCSFWAGLGLPRLYRNLLVDSPSCLATLARSRVLPRYPTTSLVLEGTYTNSSLSDLLKVLEGCQGLTTMWWGGRDHNETGCEVEIDVLLSALSSPVLCDLKHLKLFLGLDREPTIPAAIPFRLHTLSLLSCYTLHRGISIFTPIVNSSLSGSSVFLTHLDLSRWPVNGMMAVHVGSFYDLAPHLETLLLPAIVPHPSGRTQIPFGYLLRLTKHLANLSIHANEGSGVLRVTDLVPTLNLIWDSLTAPLHIFTLSAPADLMTSNVLSSLGHAMAPPSPLCELRALKFPKVTLEELKKVGGWSLLAAVLTGKAIKFVTREGRVGIQEQLAV